MRVIDNAGERNLGPANGTRNYELREAKYRRHPFVMTLANGAAFVATPEGGSDDDV
jgi:hypothetical protein